MTLRHFINSTDLSADELRKVLQLSTTSIETLGRPLAGLGAALAKVLEHIGGRRLGLVEVDEARARLALRTGPHRRVAIRLRRFAGEGPFQTRASFRDLPKGVHRAGRLGFRHRALDFGRWIRIGSACRPSPRCE